MAWGRWGQLLALWMGAILISVGAFKLPALFMGFGPTAVTYRSLIPIRAVATQVDESTKAKYVHAMEAVLRYYYNEFGSIPVPDVTLYLYGSREAFEDGLVMVAGFDLNKARIVAEDGTAAAVGRPWGMLINTTRMPRAEGLVGHEFMHLLQAVWGDRLPGNRGPTWLREGMAEWYRARINESLGVEPRGS